jgi:hypothetical protein
VAKADEQIRLIESRRGEKNAPMYGSANQREEKKSLKKNE